METEIRDNSDKKIMIVDDDPAVYDCIKHYLHNAPYELTWCQSSDEAMTNINNNYYDIYIIDYKIDRLNGIELFLKVKPFLEVESKTFKPAVLLTGYLDQDLSIKAKQAGFASMLHKDKIDKSSFIRIISNTLEIHELGRQLTEKKGELEQIDKKIKRRNFNYYSVYQTIYHELKSPLNQVNEYISLILDGYLGELPIEHKEFLSNAYHNCQFMKFFINDLLGAGQIVTGNLFLNKKNIIIDNTILSAVDSMKFSASTKNITLHYEPIVSNIEATVDESRLFQVVSNLLSNAIKYSYQDSVVKIQSYLFDESNFCISVLDNGCGIDKIQQSKIFESLHPTESNVFYNKKELCLGLNICKEIIKKHSGEIWVDSQLGKGSTFYARFPI